MILTILLIILIIYSIISTAGLGDWLKKLKVRSQVHKTRKQTNSPSAFAHSRIRPARNRYHSRTESLFWRSCALRVEQAGLNTSSRLFGPLPGPFKHAENARTIRPKSSRASGWRAKRADMQCLLRFTAQTGPQASKTRAGAQLFRAVPQGSLGSLGPLLASHLASWPSWLP